MKRSCQLLVLVMLVAGAVSCRNRKDAGSPAAPAVASAQKERQPAPAPAAKADASTPGPGVGEKEWEVACNFAVDLLKDETERRFADKLAQAAGEEKAILERTRDGMLGELDQGVDKCLDRLRGMDAARAPKAAKCLNESRDIEELKACDPLMRPSEPGRTPGP